MHVARGADVGRSAGCVCDDLNLLAGIFGRALNRIVDQAGTAARIYEALFRLSFVVTRIRPFVRGARADIG